MEEKIIMAHGSGGKLTAELIREVFSGAYGNDTLSEMEDAAVVKVSERIAYTTDSFVVRPLQYPGGDIGRLAVCGTVNDLCVRGAVPKYLSAGFIIEEGLELGLLKSIAKSMAETAAEAGVRIVTGDTKVIEGNGGLYINTSGIGIYPENRRVPGTKNIEEGDAVIVTGTLGDHHASILSERLESVGKIASDTAPLCEVTEKLMNDESITVHAMRDVTRGGLATVLSEMAESSGCEIEIKEQSLPVNKTVKAFAGMLGLDVLYMGTEGKMVVILPKAHVDRALEIIRSCKYGENAVVIGEVIKKSGGEDSAKAGRLLLETSLGAKRVLTQMVGEGLPRIC